MSEIDWTLLARYAAGECTDPERQRVEAWLAESPEHDRELRAIRAVAEQGDMVLDDVARARLLARVRARIAAADAPAAPRATPPAAPMRHYQPRHRVAGWLRTAAAAAAIVAAVGVGYRAMQQPAPAAVEAEPRVIATARAQRMSVRLPDGTAVVLAPASRLVVEPGYGEGARVVRLEGQAAFTVTHDEARPFSVVTAHGVARDLGTRFVVRAYAEDARSDVVVAEGVVAVEAAGLPGDSVVLTPNRRALYAADRRPEASRVDAERFFAWTRGELRFDRARLDEAAAQLARWYDVDVRLASPALGVRRVTASFRDEPAAQAIELVAAALDLAVERAGSGYVLRAR